MNFSRFEVRGVYGPVPSWYAKAGYSGFNKKLKEELNCKSKVNVNSSSAVHV